MGKAQNKPKVLPPWDRRPWPVAGDVSLDTIYSAVGAVLSEWERLDAALSFLFSAFIAVPPPKSARRAFSAVRTFEGRMEMLKAASGAYFSQNDNSVLQQNFKEILTQSLKFVERRNDIAHGCVEYFRPEPPKEREFPQPEEFGLFPSFATFKNRNLNDEPTYCYTSGELEFFRLEFFRLRGDAIDFSSAVTEDAARQSAQRSSLGKLRQIYRSAANPEQDGNNQ